MWRDRFNFELGDSGTGLACDRALLDVLAVLGRLRNQAPRGGHGQLLVL
jgi:hypothetical protein